MSPAGAVARGLSTSSTVRKNLSSVAIRPAIRSMRSLSDATGSLGAGVDRRAGEPPTAYGAQGGKTDPNRR